MGIRFLIRSEGQKLDLIYLLNTDGSAYAPYNIRIVNMEAYPQPTNAQISPQMHYICDAIIRFTFNDAPDPQILNFEIIGEISGTLVRSR
ncbi:MAG: hypothetical protein EZS28_006401 [Streblomastix strix]|uniref:Uncharacterized protein n=1 Tax=Streblomastix strix TaxID=222440 RepID=A0A5J4WTE4_9EUKA|nr:MAG: hypothetical protein EZS28_006401 [Streblomastix strix]